MIILTTANLRKYLDIKKGGISLPEFVNEDALWHGNIFLVQRKNVLQLCHAKTLFTIFIHGITKKDLKNITTIILEHLRYHMIHEHFPLTSMRYVDAMSSEAFSFFTHVNRKVQGSMNSMKLVYENACFSNSNIDDKQISHKINSMLIKLNGEYVTPVETFKSYMEQAVIERNLGDE